MKTALAAAAILLAFAGCMGSNGFQAQASAPILMAAPDTPAYSYDGTGMIASQGQLTIDVNDEANTGAVHVELTVPSGPYQGTYVVGWTDFHIQPNQAWQDGGIACDLEEHAPSGHGNKVEPRFDVDCAGWGTATATRDGKHVNDPVTGSADFNAHFMITKQSMLQDGNKVLKADRQTPFDPATPGDGYVDSSRMEGHFALWGQGSYKDGIALPPPPATTTQFQDTAMGATYSREFSLPIEAVESQLAVTGSMAPGVGRLTVSLQDPEGRTVATQDVTPLGPSQLTLPSGRLQLGNYTIQVVGAGVQASYTVSATVTPPAPFLLHAVFREVDA